MTHSKSSSRGESQRFPSMSEVFGRALPLLRSVFEIYGVPDSTARSAETDLTAWFVRFCRRNPDTSADAQIVALLSLACSFSRGYARLQAGENADADLAALLRETPESVAGRIAASAGIGVRRATGWARLLSFGRGKAS